MIEKACLFGRERSLVGIVTDPPEVIRPRSYPGFILLNSGIVHRVGLNRLQVRLARQLAGLGFAVMRFDFSGIGDSPARHDSLPFSKSTLEETQDAMNYLAVTRGVDQFVLIGICSGAAVAVKTAYSDPRVIGVVPINSRGYLINPNGTTSRLRHHALLRHYWRIAFSSSFRARSWLKAITGKVNYRGFVRAMSSRLKDLLSARDGVSEAEDPFKADLVSLADRGVRLLLIHAEGDEGLDYVRMILGHKAEQAWNSNSLRLEVIEGANHTFALLGSQQKLLRLIGDWAEGIKAATGKGLGSGREATIALP